MPKYTKECKIKLALEYLSEKLGICLSVAKKYDIQKDTIREWINKYKSEVFDNLSKKLKNNNYSEFYISIGFYPY
ncbi:transposase [Finegoldia magna]|uniref:transposase n=1 Tax=Finegoldia magna TaxID=1260 RepID=UPI00290BA153|nr:transposase [Finegoldia magna]MDU5201183.1 transposase [Finegoldia magna]MDU6776240.1 transposase [Finegoldia magna]